MPTQAKTILIFYTSVGLGHKFIAENLGYHLSAQGYTVKLADIGQVESGKFASALVGLHQFINRRLPWLWSWFYKSRLIYPLAAPFRLPLAGKNYRRTLALINHYRPDLVITTQTAASAVVAYLKHKGLYKNLFGIAFSDYHLHPFWLYEQADFYLANIAEQKLAMMLLGIPEDKIFVCGITLKPRAAPDIAAVKSRLKISANDKVVLFASGSLGFGGPTPQALKEFIVQLKSELAAYGLGLKFFVLCGKNQKLQNLLKSRLWELAEVLGFYEPASELYAAADLLISKPGGLTLAESLQWCLPVLVSHVLPGQEELNYQYLKNKGLIISGIEPKPGSAPGQILSEICRELLTGNFKKFLASNPDAALITGGERPGAAVLEAINSTFHRA